MTESIETYKQTIEGFRSHTGENRLLHVHTFPALARWLRSSWDLNANPSTLVNRALWLAGARRLAGSLSLQTVLLDGANMPHELPLITRAPNIVSSSIGCEITPRTAAMLDWTLETSTDPDETAMELVYDGARIIDLAAQLPPQVKFITAVTREHPSGLKAPQTSFYGFEVEYEGVFRELPRFEQTDI